MERRMLLILDTSAAAGYMWRGGGAEKRERLSRKGVMPMALTLSLAHQLPKHITSAPLPREGAGEHLALGNGVG